MKTLEIVQEMLMVEFELTPEQVQPGSKLTDLGVDSLATIEFLFLLEDRFKVDLNNNPAPIESVGDIAVEVDRQVAKKISGAAA
jgi:acyl carrier protein